MPHCGLALQHDYREACSFVTAVYRQLISGLSPARVALTGDFAGGGLALGLVQAFAAEDLDPPGRLVLISLWLDLNLLDLYGEEVDGWRVGARCLQIVLIVRQQLWTATANSFNDRAA